MRNSSSLDWLRFMHTPNDYRVSRVVHIGVGFLRCSFPIIGIAKALNMERTKVRDSHAFSIYSCQQ